MKPTHAEAEKRYKEYRAIAHNTIKNNLPYSDNNRIFLRDIDNAALSEASTWEDNVNRKVDWPWGTGYRSYSFTRPKRFEIAV